MTRPDHLFVSSVDGALYDTRVSDWPDHPLRVNYCLTHREIFAMADLKAALRAGASTDLGGYPLFFVTASGDAISYAGARANLRNCLTEIADGDPQRIVAVSINYESPDLTCELTGERIPSAYADPEPEEESN